MNGTLPRTSLLFLALLSLCLFSYFRHDKGDIGKYSPGPEGRRISLVALDYVLVTDIQGTSFAGLDMTVPVEGDLRDFPTASLQVGDYVSLQGQNLGGNRVRVTRYHVHKGRRLKQGVSVLAAAGLLFFFFHCYAFDFTRRRFLRR